MSTWRDERDQPQARVLADSVSPDGHRLTTLEVTFHRFVLAEFNTHRVLSRNSASSRAIPVAKQIEKVREHPAIPVSFPAEQKGMQGGEELTGDARKHAISAWMYARDRAVETVGSLVGLEVHKSVANRLLEPFMWHTVIVSGTDWDGFWAQRCSPLAQPEIRVAAEAMKAAYDASEPFPMAAVQWHAPLLRSEDFEDIERFAEVQQVGYEEIAKRVSTARCARVSYLTHDGQRSVEADLVLYDRLVSADPGHWSPLEHVATPCDLGGLACESLGTHRGNFVGWDQHRHEVSDS